MPTSQSTNLSASDSSIPSSTIGQWLAGGSFGSKDTVLLFRTCLIGSNHHKKIIKSETSNYDVRNDVTTKSTQTITDDGEEEGRGEEEEEAEGGDDQQNDLNACNTTTNSGNNKETAQESDDETPHKNARSSKKRSRDNTMFSSLSDDNSLSSVSGDNSEIETVIQNECSECDKMDINQQPSTSKPKEQPISLPKSKPPIEKTPLNLSPIQTTEKDSNKENEVSYLPGSLMRMSYRFQQTETRLLRKILNSHGFREVGENDNFNLLWTGVHIKPDVLRNLAPFQRVNHFPRSYELTRKDSLHKNIEKMQHLRGFKHFDIVPQSFILPVEYKDLVSAHNKSRGPWIVKPVASSRGRGIFIVNSPDQILLDEHVVVAKYISDPLCIDGHKCDIRLYVAVTSFNPLIIYMYEEGLVRIATVKYNRDAENLWNPCMHLCNYSINKYHSDYIKSCDADEEDVGHKWTLSALLRHLKNQGCDTEQLMLNMEDVIIKAIMSCAQPITSACRMFVPNFNNCFELYGFDILIDDSLKPWLLEINLSPSLGIDTPLDAKVKAALITDLLTLVGIPAIPPISKNEYELRFSIRNKAGLAARRTLSVDVMSGRARHQAPATLTAEETKMVKAAKAQYGRRGGFVRIFPVIDSMQKYGAFLDSTTGIPTSTMPTTGSIGSSIFQHNYNVMLHSQLYPNGVNLEARLEERMVEYERALEQQINLQFGPKATVNKCVDEAKRLRKQIRKLLENGNELSHLQARKAFGLYLDHVSKRLATEPKHNHEKLILKFIQRAGVNMKAPLFIRDPSNQTILSKDRGAMVAKQLGDFLQIYNRETEAYVDSFDRYGMVPIKLFNEFLVQADEGDIESILTLHTNLTRQMPFLYGHCSMGIPTAPPIPTGSHGFLRALPSMAPGNNGGIRDDAKIDSFYKLIDNRVLAKNRELEMANKLNPHKKKNSNK